MLILGIIMIVCGCIYIYKSRIEKVFFSEIKKANKKEYKKIIGTVICDAYHIDDVVGIRKAVTPIVEYEVNGEKYETCNSVLKMGAELPVGTKVIVFYNKENPKDAILGIELENSSIKDIIGVLLIIFGLIFLVLSV